MKSSWKATLLSGPAVLLLLFSMGSTARAQTSSDSPEISAAFAQLKVHAMYARFDAEKLESYSRGNISWKTHATQLNEMKEHVNNLVNDYNELATLRSSGSPWQQEAIDRIQPMIRDISSHLSATIQHLNENQNKVRMQPYRDYVKANRELIEKAHRTLVDFVDYSDAKVKADSLEQQLELPVPAKEGF